MSCNSFSVRACYLSVLLSVQLVIMEMIVPGLKDWQKGLIRPLLSGEEEDTKTCLVTVLVSEPVICW